MKKLSIVIVLILVLAIATPVSAKKHVWEGDGIDLNQATLEFPANTPAWTNCYNIVEKPVMVALGGFDCILEIDGKIVKESFAWTPRIDSSLIVRVFMWTFPEGMTGVHTFELHVFYPCSLALEEGYVSSCQKPGARIEIKTYNSVVTFTE
jgi:hypothetical protein